MENKANGKTMLLVASILLLIGGVIALITSLVGILAGSYIASTGVNGAGALATLFLVYFITSLVMALFQMVASIFGIVNHKKTEKAQACLVMGIILVALAVLNMILAFCINSFSFGLVLSLILPLLYVGGAIMNRSAHQ